MLFEADVLVIGCGIAGAATALRLAQDSQRHVVVITRAPTAEESNTRYAQGGIVGCGRDDSADLLVQDVLAAGGGLSLPGAVRVLAEEGPELVRRVLVGEAGVPFDRDDNGDLSFTHEGAHSAHRVLHVGDATGEAIERAMIAKLLELPNIELRTDLTAVELITSSHHGRDPLDRYGPVRCCGAYVLGQKEGSVLRAFANATVLATGGLGRIYRHTTNPEGARGDGVAMAFRAGARVMNAEYIQFHPTTLAAPGADNFLISEAVRGEGARLYTPDGRHFMDDYAPEWGDLAPRDVVARAIHREMILHKLAHVHLDLANHMSPDQIRERFPTIYSTCRESGIDITTEPIPVVPAAHYSCGGVQVDEWGRTNIEQLYAVGEVSCTGVHGANRLASTSLLEGLVWGDRAGRHIAMEPAPARTTSDDVPPWQNPGDGDPPDQVLMYHDRQSIQNTMWLYAGLARNARRLARARRELANLANIIDDFYRTNQVTDELLGLRNMAQVAWLVADAASHNRMSRGTHYREDAQGESSAGLYDIEGPLPDVRSEF